MMANKNINETAINAVKALQETNQSMISSAFAAQERNVRFAQSVFERGNEVLKSYARASKLMQEGVEQTQKQQSTFLGMVQSAVAAQEQTIHFAQSTFEQWINVLRSQGESAYTIMQQLTEQHQKQQEVFQTFTTASMQLFTAPLSFYRQVLASGESMARQGLEMSESVVRQGRETSQKLAQQGAEAAHKASHQK